MHYATATMQVPKYAQPGQPAQELEVRMELKVIADVGLVGFPNVGKSTLLSRVTNATSTTWIITRVLSMWRRNSWPRPTTSDAPSISPGISAITNPLQPSRSTTPRFGESVMIHVVDVASTEGRDPVDDINKINKELEAYNPEIAKRPQIITRVLSMWRRNSWPRPTPSDAPSISPGISAITKSSKPKPGDRKTPADHRGQ